MSINDIIEWCGFSSSFDILRDNMSTVELLELLELLIGEQPERVEDEIRDIAKKLGWEDKDAAQADEDERAYQQYKDGD
tara:strand:+ start:492 stop:728 length:237 start_codon:yes stop_codon:yes gene_type:complete